MVVAFESLRVLLLLLYEFAYDHLIMLMMVFLVETLLRAVVCANFVAKALQVKNQDEKIVKWFQIIYYSFIFGVIAIIMIMALFSDYTINCINTIFSYHWFILDGVDLVQSLLITGSSILLIRHMKE